MKEMRFISDKESEIVKKMDLEFINNLGATQKNQTNKNNSPKNSIKNLDQSRNFFQEENENDIDDE